jgi:hypothetical protein
MFEINSCVIYTNVGNIKPANMTIRKGWSLNMKGVLDMD